MGIGKSSAFAGNSSYTRNVCSNGNVAQTENVAMSSQTNQRWELR